MTSQAQTATQPGRPAAVPVRRRAGERDRARLAGPVGGGRARSTRRTRPARWRPASSWPPGRPKFYVLDFFPYPSGAGLHVGHPLGYIATDVLRPVPAHDRAHRAAPVRLRRVRAARRAVRDQHRPAPRGQHQPQHRQHALAAAPAGARATTTGARSPPPTPRFYRWTQWIFLQIFNSWFDEEQGRARPITELIAEFEAGTRAPSGRGQPRRPAVGTAGRADAPPGGGRLAAGLHRRGDGQLVPGPGHGAGQRGGHRRRAQRGRQLPGVPAAAAAVDAADHRLRRAAAGRPGPASTGRSRSSSSSGTGSAPATAPSSRSPSRGRAWRIEAFTTRPDTLPGATYLVLAPEHPLAAALAADRWPAGTPESGGSRRPGAPGARPPADAVRAYQERTARLGDRQRKAARDKTGVFTGAYATNPVTGGQIPVFLADYVLMGYGTGAIMARARARRARPGVRARLRAARGGRARPRADRGRHRLAGAHRARAPAADLPAAGLAVLPAAVLGRAVPDRLRRRRPAGRAARGHAAGHAARDDRLRRPPGRLARTPTATRCRRWPGRRAGPTSSWTWATAAGSTGAS